MQQRGLAFVTGGAGCLGAVLLIGFIVLALGGTVYMDIGGALLLFVIGGILGLIVRYIYDKGRRDAAGSHPHVPEERL